MKPKIFKMRGEEKFELVNRNGHAEIVANNEVPRISNVRRWEQAFRIYATIYSEASPNRSAEILQYINVINQAAAKYTWDSVAYYDHTFRRLMERKPHRSWAKTYTQIWNLALAEPLSSRQYGEKGNRRDSRDNSCWRFNKSCCSYGLKCRYEHRCSYCGGNHPLFRCFKKGKGTRESTTSESPKRAATHSSSHSSSQNGKKQKKRHHSPVEASP